MDSPTRGQRISFSTKVAAGFLVFSGAWFGLSDHLTSILFPDGLTKITISNTLSFVAATALLLKLVLLAEERRRIGWEARLRQDAIHDPLTNLLNRRAFISHLEAAVERVRRTGSRLGVAFVDLDGFKAVNDEFGHAFGDKVLQAVAQRLRATLRTADIAGRLGGDEFVVVVEPDKGDSAETLAARLLEAFRCPLEIGGQGYSLTLSIGVSHFPDNATEAEQLVRAADMAMYTAKAAGRNGFAIAEPGATVNRRPLNLTCGR